MPIGENTLNNSIDFTGSILNLVENDKVIRTLIDLTRGVVL